MIRTRKQTNDLCPLTSDTHKRTTAHQMTARIKDAFPPGIAQPALRALAAAGYTQLANAQEADLKSLHGMGPKALGILRAALEAKGKSFRT